MKIKEIIVRDIRNFVGERRFSFVEPSTSIVRPLSVLVGSNGSGKSTLFGVIEGLLSFAVDVVEDHPITSEIRETGYAAIKVLFGHPAPSEVGGEIRIAVGRKDRATDDYRDDSSQICHLEQRGASGKPFVRKGPRSALNRWIGGMAQGSADLHGGLLHFPHNRWIEHEQRGAIEPPPQFLPWLYRFEPRSGWAGSLSQLWVWQNYLDLEQGRQGRENLTPFVGLVEQILGRRRSISIKEGHVTITRANSDVGIEPHQLPSGEQQILTLFGEILRRLRRGAVVLIDEVEISLHPALQRKALHHLRELARVHDLQIIVATHSMEVVSAVSPHEVMNLDDMVLQGAAGWARS